MQDYSPDVIQSMAHTAPACHEDHAHLRPLTETIARIAREYPGKAALDDAQRSVSYAALVSLVDANADILSGAALDKSLVAVMLPRGIAYVASVLAIVQLRGVFAPIDVEWPEERILRSLRISKPAAIIIHQDSVERASALVARLDFRCDVIVAGNDARLQVQHRFGHDERPAEGACNAGSADWKSDTLYVVYTSGSTGTPHAVEGSHLSLAHFIDWQKRTFAVDAQCRVAQLAPLTFDVSLRDIFLPLCSGATLYFPVPAERYHPIRFPQWIQANRIDLLHTVPSVFKLAANMVASSERLRDCFASLRLVFFSGERLYRDDAESFYGQLHPDAQIVNLYGPSECTLIKSYFLVPRTGLQAEVVPLGFAIEGSALHVAADDGTRLGQGEILIESPFLAKGYLGDEALTRSKFVCQPDSAGRLVRQYRTGDIGKMDADGCLHFVGRKDHQVKVSGNRVELGEIELHVRSCPGVLDALVVASDASQEGGDPVIKCAFVTDGGASAASVRAHLEKKIPSYMMPARLAALRELPLLANGKPDRKAIFNLI